jgi:hypothetical protein
MSSCEIREFSVRLPQPIEQRRQSNMRLGDGKRVDAVFFANTANCREIHQA